MTAPFCVYAPESYLLVLHCKRFALYVNYDRPKRGRSGLRLRARRARHTKRNASQPMTLTCTKFLRIRSHIHTQRETFLLDSLTYTPTCTKFFSRAEQPGSSTAAAQLEKEWRRLEGQLGAYLGRIADERSL